MIKGEIPNVVDGADEGSKVCEIFQTKDYVFVDTTGLGGKPAEPTSAVTVLENLLDFFLNNQDGFHVALFLVANIRYTANSMLTFDVYRTILEDKKISCVLICTHKKQRYVWCNKVCLKLGFSPLLCTKESIVKYLEMLKWSSSEARKTSAVFYNQLHCSNVSQQ